MDESGFIQGISLTGGSVCPTRSIATAFPDAYNYFMPSRTDYLLQEIYYLLQEILKELKLAVEKLK